MIATAPSARTRTQLAALMLLALAAAGTAPAQPPRDPALLVPEEAPLLDYVPVPDPLPPFPANAY